MSFGPLNLGNNTIQVRPHTMHTCPPCILGASGCSLSDANQRRMMHSVHIEGCHSGEKSKRESLHCARTARYF